MVSAVCNEEDGLLHVGVEHGGDHGQVRQVRAAFKEINWFHSAHVMYLQINPNKTVFPVYKRSPFAQIFCFENGGILYMYAL